MKKIENIIWEIEKNNIKEIEIKDKKVIFKYSDEKSEEYIIDFNTLFCYNMMDFFKYRYSLKEEQYSAVEKYFEEKK